MERSTRPGGLLMATIQETWFDPAARDNLVYGIARHLSKTGDLTEYQEELTGLAAFLTPEEVTELYVQLSTERLEFEWRDQFTTFFPGSEAYLPAVETTEADFDAAVRAGQVRAVPQGEVSALLRAQRAAAERRWWEFWKKRG
jgi:hypothetical protein